MFATNFKQDAQPCWGKMFENGGEASFPLH